MNLLPSFLRPKKQPDAYKPENALSAPSWGSLFGGGVAQGFGETVDERIALATSAVYRCVTLISGIIASLDLGIYTNDPDKGQTLITNPTSRLLSINPFPGRQTTSFIWKETMVMNLLLWGNHYSIIRYDGAARIAGFEYVPPWLVQVQKLAGRSQYKVRWDDGRGEETIDQSDMIHIPGPGYDGFSGMSRIQINAKNSVAMARSIEQTMGAAYDNALSPSGLIELPAGSNPDNFKRIISYITATQAGSKNAGKLLPVDSGTKYTALSMNVVDLALIQAQKATDVQICAYFGVPPLLLGIDQTTSWGSGIEQILLGFLRFSLNSDLERIEAEFTQKVCSGNQFVLFDRDQLLAMDAATSATVASTEINCGILTINEARKRKHRPVVEGGDIPLVNSASIPLSKALAPAPSPPSPPAAPPTPPQPAPDAAPAEETT